MIMALGGFISGIIAGMGIGGGNILIPFLAIFTSLTQQEIQGINLIVFIPSSIAALLVHIKKHDIEFASAKPIAIFGVFGSIAGAFLALCLNSFILRKIFAVFLLIIGLFQLLKKSK